MYHIIMNPKAAVGKSRKNLAVALDTFRSFGARYEIHCTQYEKHAEKLARELTERGVRDIVAFGGDGTIHEILNGLTHPEEVRLGILPAGTGNDFVDFVGIPRNPKEAATLIVTGRARPADYIRVGERRSVNSVGLGIDVDVLQRRIQAKWSGRLSYFFSLIVSIIKFKNYHFIVKVNGREEDRHSFVAVVCNGGLFGGGRRICPKAEIDDGKLQLVIVDLVKKVQIWGALFALMRGKILDYPATDCYDVEEVEIIPCSDKESTIQMDGELYAVPFRAEVVKGGFQLYRPEKT